MNTVTRLQRTLAFDDASVLVMSSTEDDSGASSHLVVVEGHDRVAHQLRSQEEVLRWLASLDREQRERILADIPAAVSNIQPSESSAELLRAVRAVLREPLRLWLPTSDEPAIDAVSIAAVDDRTFCVSVQRSSPATDWSVRLVSPEGERVPFDVPGDGTATPVTAVVHLECPSLSPDCWLVEVLRQDEPVGELPFPVVERHADSVRTALGRAWCSRADDRVLEAARVWRRRLREHPIAGRARFAPPHAAASATTGAATGVLVDVEGVTGLEHHLAAVTPAGVDAEVDIVYLVREAAPPDRVLDAAADLHTLYGVGFDVVVVPSGVPFSLARVAASEAYDVLVMLSADLVPAAAAWLSTLLEAYRARPGSVVTPKLIDVDGSVLSAGWQFGGDGPAGLAPRFGGAAATAAEAERSAFVDCAGPGCLIVSADAYRRAVDESPPFVGDGLDAFDASLRMGATYGTWYVPVEFIVAPVAHTAVSADVESFDGALLAHAWGKGMSA